MAGEDSEKMMELEKNVAALTAKLQKARLGEKMWYVSYSQEKTQASQYQDLLKEAQAWLEQNANGSAEGLKIKIRELFSPKGRKKRNKTTLS